MKAFALVIKIIEFLVRNLKGSSESNKVRANREVWSNLSAVLVRQKP